MSNSTFKLHDVVIETDGNENVELPRRVLIDGQEVIVAGGRKVTVECSRDDAFIVLLPVICRSVRIEPE